MSYFSGAHPIENRVPPARALYQNPHAVSVEPWAPPATALYQQSRGAPLFQEPEGHNLYQDGELAYEGLREEFEGHLRDPSFSRNFQFGIIENSVVVASTLLGAGLEKQIASVTNVKGYGAVMGATVGNAISNGIAAYPQGTKAVAGITLGALVPVVPLLAAMLMKKEIKGTTQKVLLGSSVALLVYGFASKTLKQAQVG
jgi:hypothetical protein